MWIWLNIDLHLCNFKFLKHMNHKVARTDISEWVIHFVHERKPENDISSFQDIFRAEGGIGELRDPDYFDSTGEGQNILSSDEENEYEIPIDASAFQVLLKVLHDGFLHSGWSYRNNAPTIYGPRSAVCFTEMPLHAFIKYAEDRGKKTGLISQYAIALKKNEFFKAGGRPVIYGLSSKHVESDGFEMGVYQGRCLSIKDTGIGIHEQYRYVATSFDSDKFIDWTHEREWRWPLPNDMHVPGLPLFLDEYYGKFFSEILVFVKTCDEKKAVLNYLKTLYDSGSWNNGIEYDIMLIQEIKVASIEDISHIGDIDLSKVKVENLPFSVINKMPNISVSAQKQKLVKEKLEQAIILAEKAMICFQKDNPSEANRDFDYGWTYVCTSEVSETTQALIKLGFSTYADGVYRKNIISGYEDSMTTQIVGAEVAAKYLSRELGQSFYVLSHSD